MAFASDNFGSTFGTELATYSASWSKQNSFTTNNVIGSNNSSVITTDTNYGVYQHSASPASADYSVFCTVTQVNSGAQGFAGPIGRASTSAATFYTVFVLNDRDEIRVYKWVAGTQTQIGSSTAISLSDGVAVSLELRMSGTSISAYADAVAKCGSPITDSAISGAGKAGLLCNFTRTTGVNDYLLLDTWSAEDAGGAASVVKRLMLLGVGV